MPVHSLDESLSSISTPRLPKLPSQILEKNERHKATTAIYRCQKFLLQSLQWIAENTVEIVLVEPKEYTEMCWAAYRAPFDETTLTRSLSPVAPFCQENHVQHIRSVVTKLTVATATLANGGNVPFDVCVIATGATTDWPALGRGPAVVTDGSIEARKALAASEGEDILNSKSVLIIGGGLTGSKLAGDMAGFAKLKGKDDLKVTLVHSESHLCPEMSEQAAGMVQTQLEAAGVKVILNELALPTDTTGVYKLMESGETITADKIILTTGITACNDFMKNIEGALDERGFCNTDDYFRVAGTSGKIFALGDCCITLPNAATQLLENIKIIGYNVNATLNAMEKGETTLDSVALRKFQLGPLLFVSTTGPASGVFYHANLTTKRFFPWFKNKTMFFFHAKWDLGLKPISA